MAPAEVQDLMLAFNKALIERAVGAEMNLHLGYPPGQSKRAGQANERNGASGKTVITDRGPVRIADKYAEVRRTVAEIFEDNHRSYGYRRMQAALSRQRVFLLEKVVHRLMEQGGLHAARPKQRRYRSYIGEISPAPDNINITADWGRAAHDWKAAMNQFAILYEERFVRPSV